MNSLIKLTILAFGMIMYVSACKTGNSEKEETVTDVDGNVYSIIHIGNQVWMGENLKTRHYNDGTPIPVVAEGEKWRNMTSPAMCWYDNSESKYKNTYGALYNWYAASSGNICPEGWHVPTEEDWEILKEYLVNYGFGYGENELIGKSLASSKGWKTSSKVNAIGNNQSMNDKTGYKAYPGGIRFSNGEFRHMFENAKWWSADESSNNEAVIRFLSYNDSGLSEYSNRKENGFSIRCVKDETSTKKKKKYDSSPIEKEVDNNTAEKSEEIDSTSILGSNEPGDRFAFISSRWDSLAAVRYIMKDLDDTTGWPNEYEDFVAVMSNTNYGVFDLTYKEMNFKIGLSFSEFFDCPPYCGGPVFSIHEFQETGNGWYLTNKSKGFIQFDNWRDFQDSDIFPLSANSYGMWFKGYHINPRAEPAMYSFINILAFEGNEFKSILYSSNDYNDISCRVFEFNNKSFVRITKHLEGEKIQENYKYENGKYSEYTGPFRAASMEDLYRDGYLTYARDKESGICPNCNGTGICPMCGGTGKIEHGIECMCVRTYKIEVASGNTPQTVPYKCPRCKGTGHF